MTKIVISERFGGFGISRAAANYMGIDPKRGHYDLQRDDPKLVEAVEMLGKDANGGYADLKVVEIPDGIEWHVHEYDGYETVHESHRSWNGTGEQSGCS